MVLHRTCPTCNEPALFICLGCKDIRYCSRECQETDYPWHRLLCRGDYTERPEGHPDARRILVFPGRMARPDMMWVGVFRHTDGFDGEGRVICEQPDMTDGELMGRKWPVYDTITHNSITGAKLPYHIHLCFHEETLEVGAEINEAVQNATCALPAYPWCENIVAFCGKPTDENDEASDIIEVLDMDMTAYSHTIAFLIDRLNDEPRYLVMKGPKISAVQVVCDDEIAHNGIPRYRSIRIPRLHEFIRGEGEISAISNAIGMRLVIIPYKLLNKQTVKDFTNIAAYAMLCRLSLTPDLRKGDREFGRPGAPWQDAPKNMGNVLVFREDFAPLEPDVLLAFVGFCQKISQVCRQAKSDKQRKAILAGTNGKKWSEYLARWRELKAMFPTNQAPSTPETQILSNVANGGHAVAVGAGAAAQQGQADDTKMVAKAANDGSGDLMEADDGDEATKSTVKRDSVVQLPAGAQRMERVEGAEKAEHVEDVEGKDK